MPGTIVSGGLIRETRSLRAVAAPLPYTETWTVGDHTGLNGDKSWTAAGGGLWAVNSQQALLTGTSSAASRGQCNVDCGTDDYAATVTFATYAADVVGLLSAGPCVRMQGDASLTFYAGVLVTSGGSFVSATILKFLAGAQSTIGALATVTPHSNMTLTLRVVGSSLRLLFDGAPVVSTTDPDIPTGRFAGIQGVATGANLVRLDNLAVAAAAGGIARVPLELLSLTPYAGVR